MRYVVRSFDHSGHWPDAPVRVIAILGRVANLISTRIVSCPLCRAFGLPMRFVDKPENVAKPIAAVEVAEGLREWVPEASLHSISFERCPGEPTKHILAVEVDISDELY